MSGSSTDRRFSAKLHECLTDAGGLDGVHDEVTVVAVILPVEVGASLVVDFDVALW